LVAAERFAQGVENAIIAHGLRVSVRSVQRWRKAWSEGEAGALASKGPASLPLLSDELFAVLEKELARGPVAHGWPDQTWTLSRIKTLIGRRFHKSYTIQGIAALMKRHGWNCQVPARRAVERDDAGVASWVKETWPDVKDRGGARRLARLRRRGRLLDDAADHAHLVPPRPHTGRPRQGSLPPPLIGGRPSLLQGRRTVPADLPALPRRPP
jgi:transposase